MSSVADKLEDLIEAKADMKAAIESKGVTVTGGLSTYADAIDKIEDYSFGYDWWYEKDESGYTEDMKNKPPGYVRTKQWFDYFSINDDGLNIALKSTEPIEWVINLSGPYTMVWYAHPYFVPKANMFRGYSKETDNEMGFLGGYIPWLSLKYIPVLKVKADADLTRMCAGLKDLKVVAGIDTSETTNMTEMFKECIRLEYVPEMDTSKVTTMRDMFIDCHMLSTIPQYNTVNVTDMRWMFAYCYELTSVPALDCSSVNNIGYMFFGTEKLTDVGGFINLGMQSNLTGQFAFPDTLTSNSILNIINNLYDRAAAGYTVITLNVPNASLAELSAEEIAIATNKGWILQ